MLKGDKNIQIDFVTILHSCLRTYLMGRRTVIRMLGTVQTETRYINTYLRNPILAVVVFSFFFCWTPFHAQRLMFVFVTLKGEWSKSLTRAQHILFMISGQNQNFSLIKTKDLILGVFYYFNSTLNPVLYSLLSKRFQEGFHHLKRNFMQRACHFSSSSSDHDLRHEHQDFEDKHKDKQNLVVR